MVHLYEGDLLPMSSLAPKAKASCESELPRRWMCSIFFCRQNIGQRFLSVLDSLMIRYGWLRSLALKAGDCIQRMIPILPWAAVKAIVAMLGRLEALESMRYYRPLVSGDEHNPLLEVQISQLLSKEECHVLVQDAEAYACANGWTTSRHATHATTDIPVQLLPEGGRLWNETIAVRVKEALADNYDLRPDSVTPVDVFLVKYQFADGGQRELSVHRDGALMTFSLLLNDPSDFEGGGTYFEESGRVYRPAQGVAVMHSGKLRHGGFPITAGTRYVLVGFCLVDHEKISPELKDWRWGEPPWYLSSAVVRDHEVLDRIYNPKAALAQSPVTPSSSHKGNKFESEEQSNNRGHSHGDIGPSSHGASAGDPQISGGERVEAPAVEGTPGAENPKYRADAISRSDACRKGSAGGVVVKSQDLGGGLRAEMFAHLDAGHVTTLLVDGQAGMGDAVIGHVLSNDAGYSDVVLDATIDQVFPDEDYALSQSRPIAKEGPFLGLKSALGRGLPTLVAGIAGKRARGMSKAPGANRRRIVGLVSIVVDRNRRERGFGRRLMAATMCFYKELGFDFVLLQQRDTGSGRLIAFYKEFGFQEAYSFLDLAMLAKVN